MSYNIMRFPDFKDKALTLSYDDGVVYDEKLIDIMSNYGLKGTFNINSGLFSEDGIRRLTKEQALKLYSKTDNEVAIHGKMHLSLAQVDEAVATYDVINDRMALENLFGKIIKGMAYANGSYSDKVVEILKHCGIEYARTTISTERFDIPRDWLRLPATCHHKNTKLMELAHEFIENNEKNRNTEPKLFYLWGHSYEFNDQNNWNIIEEFAKYIGNRSDVWYATNGEIYNYIKAFDSLCFSTDAKMIYNPSAIDIYLHINENDYIVKSGQTLII